jgi:hypothetical protein
VTENNNISNKKFEVKASTSGSVSPLRRNKDRIIAFIKLKNSDSKPGKSETKKFKNEMLLSIVVENFPQLDISSPEDITFFRQNNRQFRIFCSEAMEVIDETLSMPTIFIEKNLSSEDWELYLSDNLRLKDINKELQRDLDEAARVRDAANQRAEQSRLNSLSNSSVISQIMRLNRSNLPLSVQNEINKKIDKTQDARDIIKQENVEFNKSVEKYRSKLLDIYTKDRDSFNIGDFIAK